MTRARLDEICQQFRMKIDHIHQSAGKFVDVHIGTGEPRIALETLRDAIVAEHGCADFVVVDRVTNPDHEDYRKSFLNVTSFWNE